MVAVATRARLERREAGNEAMLSAGPGKQSHSHPFPLLVIKSLLLIKPMVSYMAGKKLPLRYTTSSNRVIPTSVTVSPPTNGELYTDRKLKGSVGAVWAMTHASEGTLTAVTFS